jgi:hypothetical protein
MLSISTVVRNKNVKKQKLTAVVRRLFAGIFLIGALCALQVQTVSAAVTNQSMAVPMYEYPTIGTFWDDITGVGSSTLPWVIVNPASGPGVSVDPNYTAEIAENTADGIRSIGYVHTTYQTRNWQDVYDDINDWYTMYPGISGIFIDLVDDGTQAQLCYAAMHYNLIKNAHPNDLVIINPGWNISMDYEPYGDIFMNAENTFALYQGSWSVQYPGWEDNPAYQNRFWHGVHTTNSGDLTTALNLTRANNAGWVYITDDVMPNPYKVTPTYLASEVTQINSLPASTIPNRGKTQLPTGCLDLAATTSAPTTTTSAKQVTTKTDITVNNTSATYVAYPSTRIKFTLPAGVKLASGSGNSWNCDPSDASCAYTAPVPASGGGSANVLGASFTADCDYSSGNITGTLSNFSGNSSTFTITPTKPGDCAASLADAGVSAGLCSALAGGLAVAGVTVYRRRGPQYRAYPLRSRRK